MRKEMLATHHLYKSWHFLVLVLINIGVVVLVFCEFPGFDNINKLIR